jgi:hypothetical protein
MTTPWTRTSSAAVLVKLTSGDCDQAEGAAARDDEANPVHGAQQPGVGIKGDGEVSDVQEVGH